MQKKQLNEWYFGKRNRWFSFGIIMTACVLITAFFGCAHLMPKVSEQDLRERVAKVWQAKMDGNCAVIYEIASSKYRGQVTLEQHQVFCRSRPEKFDITAIEFSEDRTKAKVSIRFDIRHMGFLIPATLIQENWIQEDGQWVVDLTPINSGRSPF